MPTPKSLRQPPDRTFENYILTLSREKGLLKVPEEKFSLVPGNAGKPRQSSGLSGGVDIGFSFLFDGITYKKFNVSVDGWIVLVDPTTTFTASDVLVDSSSPYRNIIKPTFSANHAFFAVWWSNLINTSDDADSVVSEGYKKGIEPINTRVNPRKFAIRYCNHTSTADGRMLIVRWSSTTPLPYSNRIEFEIVFYENGKIEFRYAPRKELATSSFVTDESATIGIFMPNGTYRFRDFSYELTYDLDRPKYKFGGSISGSYVDSVWNDVTLTYEDVPYGGNLVINDWWPGQQSTGAIFTFQPPLNRRKVLPRLSIKERDARTTLPTTARTGDRDRSGSDGIRFDDRKSIAYSTNALINYPTTLPRFYAQDLFGVARNQDLFLEDFVLTGTIRSSNVQEYLEDNEKKFISPFSEYKLFENDPAASSDSFFTNGSSIQDVGEGFSQPLKSKTQIRLSFRVDHKTTLFGASSSIYYFNSKTGRWQYPTASFMNGGFDIAEPYADPSNGRLMEIDRGFNCFGFNIASGSSDRNSFPRGTINQFNNFYSRDAEVDLLTGQYDKTISINREYDAVNDETISIPINQPFLLEKAVVELPIEAGPGWFYDKTQCVIPTVDGPPSPSHIFSQDGVAFDIGGPGLTFSLYNQVSVGPRKYKRDLILTGTVTHDLDNVSQIAFFQPTYGSTNLSGTSIPIGDVWQVVPRGFLAYGSPSTVVSGTNNFFTGNIKIKCEAAISNGVLIRDTFFIDQDRGSYMDYVTGSLEMLFNNRTWDLTRRGTSIPFNTTPRGGAGGDYRGYGSRELVLVNVNNFGRSCSGFEPSGRSILGKEHATSQLPNYYDNPFYKYKNSIVKLDHMTTGPVSELPQTVDEAIYELSQPGEAAIAISVVQRQQNKTSPYLLFPNDRLIMCISKSRPFFLSAEAVSPFTMNQIQHDVKLTTGSINITLYGSLVSNGKEFHDTLNQELSTDAIHDVVVGGTKTW